MTNLEELSVLYEKATPGQWEEVLDKEPPEERLGTELADIHGESRCVAVGGYDIDSKRYQGSMLETDAEYIVALHNAFPALQREILAGRKLAEAVRGIHVSHNPPIGKPSSWEKQAWHASNIEWCAKRDAALAEYESSL